MYIDADGHVLEPPTGLIDYAPAGFKERVLHLETDTVGHEWLVWNDRRVSANPYALAGTAGLAADVRLKATKGELKYSEVRPSAFEAAGYIKDMDVEGIDAAIVYPSLLLNVVSEPDLEWARLQASAYNRYISDFVSSYRQRLFAAAIIPQRDIPEAAKEIERVGRLPGIVAVMIRPNPTADWRPLSDEVYTPLWRAASDAGLSIALHPSGSTGANGIAEAIGITHLGSSAQPLDTQNLVTHNADNAFFPSSLAQVDVMNSLMFLLAGGVCERFGDLRLVFLEANGGWIVPWLERLDDKAKAYPWDVPVLKHPPSEYFRRQCWISFDPDESALPFTASSPICGAERIVWASDYPHQDSKFPGVVRDLDERIVDLEVSVQDRVRGGNALSLYAIDAGTVGRAQPLPTGPGAKAGASRDRTTTA